MAIHVMPASRSQAATHAATDAGADEPLDGRSPLGLVDALRVSLVEP
jgi:hypothetical protein